ncbi:unnamed protein product, partial [Iphiclides podalirius]
MTRSQGGCARTQRCPAFIYYATRGALGAGNARRGGGRIPGGRSCGSPRESVSAAGRRARAPTSCTTTLMSVASQSPKSLYKLEKVRVTSWCMIAFTPALSARRGRSKCASRRGARAGAGPRELPPHRPNGRSVLPSRPGSSTARALGTAQRCHGIITVPQWDALTWSY